VKRTVVLLIVLVAVTLSVWLIWRRATEPLRREEVAEIERTREVTLYFGSDNASSLQSEYRQIASSDKVLDNLRRVIEELISGPREGAVPTLPSSARVRGVFIHDKTAFIDFSEEIIEDFSGGTAAEYMLVTSLVQTVCANFYEVETVRVLVEGEEVDTIGGHLLISKPLRPQEWR
jgi:spore germination protein GerM